MHYDVTPGRITLSSSNQQLIVTWDGFEGLNRAEFRVEENVARLATIGASQEGSDKPMEVSDPTLDDIPQHFLKILEGEGYDLRQSESAHDDKFGL